MKIEQLEALRKKQQVIVDSKKTLLERNQMGQYSTPYELAEEVTKFVLNQWTSNKNDAQIRFIEPAIGTGVFYSALRSQLLNNSVILSNALGIELDKSFYDASAILPHQALSILRNPHNSILLI